MLLGIVIYLWCTWEGQLNKVKHIIWLRRCGGSLSDSRVSSESSNIQCSLHYGLTMVLCWLGEWAGTSRTKMYELIGAACGKPFASRVSPRSWNMYLKSDILRNVSGWRVRVGRTCQEKAGHRKSNACGGLGEACRSVFVFLPFSNI